MKNDKELKKLNEKWEIHALVQNAIATAHTSPSPETLRELENLRVNDKKIVDKLDNLEQNLTDMKVQIAELPKKLADEFDNRYASKLAERIVYSMVGLMISAILLAVLALVLKS